MTFMKYVDMEMCCFIPGKVIDEIFKVLRTIQHDKNPPRAYEVLQELRDISSMAMEYFDEHIVPTFKISSNSYLSSPTSNGRTGAKFQSPAAYLSGLPAILTSSMSLPSTPLPSKQASISTSASATAMAEKFLVLNKTIKSLIKRQKKHKMDSKRQMADLKQVIIVDLRYLKSNSTIIDLILDSSRSGCKDSQSGKCGCYSTSTFKQPGSADQVSGGKAGCVLKKANAQR